MSSARPLKRPQKLPRNTCTAPAAFISMAPAGVFA
jgi:hypothetical protein